MPGNMGSWLSVAYLTLFPQGKYHNHRNSPRVLEIMLFSSWYAWAGWLKRLPYRR